CSGAAPPSGRTRSFDLAHGGDEEGAHDAVLLQDRDVLARQEGVLREAVAGFVVAAVAVDVVVEGPLAAAPVDDVADLGGLSRPEALDPAAVLHLLPGFVDDMPRLVERRDEVVAALAAAGREVGVSRELQSDAAQ